MEQNKTLLPSQIGCIDLEWLDNKEKKAKEWYNGKEVFELIKEH